MTNIRLSIVGYTTGYREGRRDTGGPSALAASKAHRNRFRGIASGKDPMKTRQIAHNDYPAARHRSPRAVYNEPCYIGDAPAHCRRYTQKWFHGIIWWRPMMVLIMTTWTGVRERNKSRVARARASTFKEFDIREARDETSGKFRRRVTRLLHRAIREKPDRPFRSSRSDRSMKLRGGIAAAEPLRPPFRERGNTRLIAHRRYRLPLFHSSALSVKSLTMLTSHISIISMKRFIESPDNDHSGRRSMR